MWAAIAPVMWGTPTTTGDPGGAWEADWSSRYTSTGTAMIEPPPPSAPRDRPMSAPAATARSSVISDVGPVGTVGGVGGVALGAHQVQADLLGVLEGVVDCDGGPAAPGDERGHNPAAGNTGPAH